MLKKDFTALARLGIGGALLALAVSCDYAHGPDPVPATAPTVPGTAANPCNDPTPPTYAAVVAPILDARCRGCHGTAFQTRGGGTDLSTYAAVAKVPASLLLGTVQHEPGFSAMPKGGAKLSDCDIARLQGWVDAGRPNN